MDTDLRVAQGKYAQRVAAASQSLENVKALGTRLLMSKVLAEEGQDVRLEVVQGQWYPRPLEVTIRSSDNCVYKEIHIPAKSTPS